MMARQILIKCIKRIKPLYAVANRLKAKREAKLSFAKIDSPPIIIYQMGKVGSSTVYESLVGASLSNPILHLHFLSRDLSEHRCTMKQAGIYPLPYHIYLGEATRTLLDKHQDFPIKIISLVRDPIAFVISDLFQNPYFADESVQTGTGSIDPQKASNYINRKLSDANTFTYIYEWFNKELKTVFGIDVFAEPFPLETGYAVYSRGNIEALVIRLEDLSKQGPKAISDFLGLRDALILKQSNTRNNSKEKEAYQEVQDNVAISPFLCRKIYSSKFVKHFYNEAMIDKFTSTWAKRSTNANTRVQSILL